MKPLMNRISKQSAAVEAQIADFVSRVIFPENDTTWDHLRSEDLMLDPFGYKPECLEIPQIASRSRVLLIGNAGSGKSYILKKVYALSAERFLNSHIGSIPLYYELNKVASQYGIEGSLRREYPQMFAPDQGEQTYALFLDELDKRLISVPNPHDFVNELQYFLKEHSAIINSVFLACRRPFYNSTWFDDNWQVYHTDILRRSDYAQIISDERCLKEFFSHIDSLGIRGLLNMPIIGFDLAQRFSRGESLPSTRRDWFEQKIAEMLGRNTHSPICAPSRTKRWSLAEQLACLSLFGQCSPWTDIEAWDQIGDSRVIGDTFTFEEVRHVLQSPLFTKSGNLFDFSHQLFAEYLAATALHKVSLRKQRQLLTTSSAVLCGRIGVPYRGVAAFLAEVSSEFLHYLLQQDPLVAFLAELPMTSSDFNDRLLSSMMDEAIRKGRAPWWQIPPRDEMLIQYIPKHRPSDLEAFFRPYLEMDDEFALLWATAFLRELGGDIKLNPLLLDLAHDVQLNLETRKSAIDAILATGEVKNITQLYDLMNSRYDDIRGHVIHAYRITESPGPSQVISRFVGGASQPNYIGSLHMEAYRYIRDLDTRLIPEAFNAVIEHYNHLGDLPNVFLRELLTRTKEDGVNDIPPEIVIRSLCDVSGLDDYEKQWEEILSQSSGLFSQIWQYVFAKLGTTPPGMMWTRVDRFLGEICSDVIFDLLPKGEVDLTKDQKNLIRAVLKHYFYRDPTQERLEQFQSRAPVFADDLKLPERRTVKFTEQILSPIRQRVLYIFRVCKVVGVLYNRETAVNKTIALLRLMAKHLKSNDQALPELEEMVTFVEQLLPLLRKRVLSIFAKCVESITYSRICKESGELSITLPLFASPFWILRKMGYTFLAQKIEEITTAYAFLNLSSFDIGSSEEYIRLLEELREQDPERWQRCVLSLSDPRISSPHSVLRYLAERKYDIYLEQCRDQLSKCDFTDIQFKPLLDYWIALKPPDFVQVLIRCYESTECERISRMILYQLLQEDVDWAWTELERLIDIGQAPSAASVSSVRSMQLPRNPERLPIIVDWYADLRRRGAERDRDSESGAWQVHPSEDMISFLNETIISIGGEETIQELKHLQVEKAFPSAKWLSYSIIRIEDNMLTRAASMGLAPSALLAFVNKESMGIVNNERDLFEWICQAIEDEKFDLEGPGKGVQGYWDYKEPKHETGCQNVLWPKLSLRLSNLSITGVEEKFIGPNRVDFWVEKQVSDQESLKVAVETKVARKNYASTDLIDPIETQLWMQYLKPIDIAHGIYVVFWFKDAERYPYPTVWDTPDELLTALESKKSEVENSYGVNLECYVIDVTAPSREH